MLSMKEKTLIGFVIVFIAAVTANFIIPVKTFEVKLVTNPARDGIFAPARQAFNVTCQGLGDDGNKFHSMRWLNTKGNVIPEGTPGVIKHGTNSLQLVFTEPKPEDSGTYKCLTVYDSRNTLEKAIKITFYGEKPIFESAYENITAEEGSELQVNCSAIGDDESVHYEWYKYEDRISEDINSPIFVLDYGSARSVLVIREVSESDEGVYVCLAKNEIGVSSKMHELTVLSNNHGNESSILSIEAGNITSNSVLFFIDASFNGSTSLNESARFIEVKYTEKRQAVDISKKWEYGDDYEVKDLIPGGSYTFRFRTVLGSKRSAWSKQYQVILLPDAPEVIFRSLNEGNVKIEWYRNIDNILRETIEGFELKYFPVQITHGDYWVASQCAITIQLPTCIGSSYTITGLNKDTHYEIQLRAKTHTGFGEAYKQKIRL